MIDGFGMFNENAMIKTTTGKDVHVSCIEPGAEILACEISDNIITHDHLSRINFKPIEVRGIIQWKVESCCLINDDLMVTPNQLIPIHLEIKKIKDVSIYNRIFKAKIDEHIEIEPAKLSVERFDNLNETFYGILTDQTECIFVNNILMFTNGDIR